ncbi:MAG: glycosyltransferase [bacterium]|nr:glycosyltransferase [bacterium]
MRLLIVTQAVDQGDSDLGFFVRWIEEFAKHAERIEVICLKLGRSDLPRNVRIHSLGKENNAAENTTIYGSVFRRVRYTFRFLSLIWKLRNEYDTVFVHMNPEYIVLGGIPWKIWGKRIALWYTHKSVNLKLRFAASLADIIFTASKESFRLKSRKVHVMRHGINTVFFSPDPSVTRGDWILSVGRLMPSKRHDLAIERAVQEGRALRIAGEGPERARLEAFARERHASVQFLGALTQAQLRDEYRRAAAFIHTSETGSLDKVVLEALACGLKVITNDPALKSLEHEGPQYVRENHSLQKLIPAILSDMQAL